jgi:NDP-4-keto-2,6-dideoxyhexose 3-C-methyltransferase
LLKKNGVWVLEMSYLPLMLKNLTYDQICHEHLTYYDLTVFKKIIEKHNLKIIDVSLNEINGGSIEIMCAKKDSKFKTNKKKISKFLKDEVKITEKSYKNFNNRINKIKELVQMFLNLNAKKKVIGYGASTKGNIVLNHCQIKNNQIKEICDGSAKKVSRYTPGSNIKIISKEKMRKKNPDYLLVLIWSFRKEVIKQELNFLKNGGKLVFHLPRFHIVNVNNFKSYLKKDFKNLSYNY